MRDSSLFHRLPEFPQIKGIVNTVTGQIVPVDCEIHGDDLDWLTDTWQEIYLLDWKIAEAQRDHELDMPSPVRASGA